MLNRSLRAACSVLLIAATAPALSACGFTPLYADNDQSLTRALAEINVLPIRQPELASYVLESEMKDFTSSTARTRYDLSVELEERRQSVAVTSQAQVARFEYRLTAVYTLLDNDSGKRYRNSKSVVTSYGIVASQYSSLVGQEDAIRKAAVELAQVIETDLVFYFRGQVDGTEVEAGQEFLDRPDEESLRQKELDDILGEEF